MVSDAGKERNFPKMCEVDKGNFKQHLPALEQAIRQADFVAFDTEFTGLSLDPQSKPSLFDNAEDRYKRLRETVSKITILQLGLSLFSKDPQEDSRYITKSYNFYLYPGSFGPVDVKFVCQASSLEFLCKYNFDFNKFIYSGIPFLNEETERQVREHLASKAMFTGLHRNIDEKKMQKVCSIIAQWFIQSDVGSSFDLSAFALDGLTPFVVSSELKSRFPRVWTTIESNGNITVKKISPERREVLESEVVDKHKEQEEKMVLTMLGFTRVFRVLKECKKPLLGHNMVIDLLLLYDKFHKPLPVSYSEFKKELHMLFPRIYDSKHITFMMRKRFEEMALLNSTALADVYCDLNSNKGRDVVIHPPAIEHAKGFDKYVGNVLPHEAGFDAFMCGFVFLRLAHIQTFENVKSSDVIPCSFRRYLQSMSPFVNKLNLIRASTNYMCLDGPEPPSVRPELLYVKSRKFKKLNVEQLAKWFSPYGSVDIRLTGSSHALVAAGNFSCARSILQSFRKHNSIYVTKYSVWKHSANARYMLWTGALVSGGLCVWALLSVREKTT